MKETLGEFIKDNIDDAFRNLGDDVGRHFASKTGFQKLMGNNATRFLTGVQAGMSSFLWQLPLMVVSTTASINKKMQFKTLYHLTFIILKSKKCIIMKLLIDLCKYLKTYIIQIYKILKI